MSLTSKIAPLWIDPWWRSFKDRHHNLSDVYRYWDSLVTFYLLFMLDLFRFVVLHEETMIRCNLLFDLIDHFSLLKDVNISFFLQWLASHGISINTLPLFQYSLDCSNLNITKEEKNKLIWIDIITWIMYKHGSTQQHLLARRRWTTIKHIYTHMGGWIYRLYIYPMHCTMGHGSCKYLHNIKRMR